MTLARTPYARLSPADIGQVDRELKKLEQMSAGLYVPKVLVAARSPYTVQATDTMLLCDCTAGVITLTFPLAARVDGMWVQIVKSDTSANVITLSGTFSGVVNPTLVVQNSGFTVFALNGAYYLTAVFAYPAIAGEVGVTVPVFPYGDVRRYGAIQGVGAVAANTTAFLNCSISCFGSSASPHGAANQSKNIEFYIPQGDWYVNQTVPFPQLTGARIRGAGRFAASVTQVTANIPAFQTNGCGYTRWSDFRLANAATNTGMLFDLNWDGTSGGSALQSNTFENIYFEGNLHTALGVSIGTGGNMGSENLFLNCFANGFTTAGYVTQNFNALQNSFVGGNLQSCTKYGIWVFAGSVHVFSVGFQNAGTQGEQITNNGYDLFISNSSDDVSTIRGCRSESFRFIGTGNQHVVLAEGCNYTPSFARWSAGATVVLNSLWTGTTTAGDGKIYRATTVVGVTGGVEPVWASGVVDGGVTWTLVDFTIVSGPAVSLRSCILPFGTIQIGTNGPEFAGARVEDCVFSRTDWASLLYNNGTALGTSKVRLSQNLVKRGGGPNSGGLLQQYRSSNSGFGAIPPLLAITHENLGDAPLLWSRGSAGVMSGDVGFIPNPGSPSTAALNTLGLVGTLAAVAPTAANTAGTDTIISGGQGTGIGVSGKLRLRATPAGGAGSTANTPVDIALVDEAGVSLPTAGLGFKVKEGTNATMGTAVLVAGTLVVSTTKVTANSRIMLTSQVPGGTPGWLQVQTRTAATSFTILSSSATDTSTVAWLIVEPA